MSATPNRHEPDSCPICNGPGHDFEDVHRYYHQKAAAQAAGQRSQTVTRLIVVLAIVALVVAVSLA